MSGDVRPSQGCRSVGAEQTGTWSGHGPTGPPTANLRPWGLLGFWQEHGAAVTVERLLDQVRITGEVRRGGRTLPVERADIVLGDVLVLDAGDLVTCDCRILTADALRGGTELGRMSETLAAEHPHTSFEKGSVRSGSLLARVTAVLTAAILVVNAALGRPLFDAVLFSLALAVGVTPQMLPAIVSVSLSTGARRMARAKVIVR